MKRVIAIMLAVMMIFMFTACKKSESATPDKAEKEVTETADEPEKTEDSKADESEETNRSTGIIETLSSERLTIYTDTNESLTFNVKDVKIDNADKIQSGDNATVEYKGKVSGGNTSECEVTKVTSTEGSKLTLNGKVKSIDKSKSVMSLTSSDKKYDFDYSDVKTDGDKIESGDSVEVVYTGILTDTDTSHAYVKSLKVTKKAEDNAKAAVSGDKSKSTSDNKEEKQAKKKAEKAKKKADDKAAAEVNGKDDKENQAAADVNGDESGNVPQSEEEEKSEETPKSEEAKEVTVEGILSEYDDKENLITITTEDKKELVFDIEKAKVKGSLEESLEKIITVEYLDNGEADKYEAIKITAPAEEKPETASAFSGGTMMILILAVAAIIAGMGIFVSRKKRNA